MLVGLEVRAVGEQRICGAREVVQRVVALRARAHREHTARTHAELHHHVLLVEQPLHALACDRLQCNRYLLIYTLQYRLVLKNNVLYRNTDKYQINANEECYPVDVKFLKTFDMD